MQIECVQMAKNIGNRVAQIVPIIARENRNCGEAAVYNPGDNQRDWIEALPKTFMEAQDQGLTSMRPLKLFNSSAIHRVYESRLEVAAVPNFVGEV